MANLLENQTIYEIFRACRLCGAGGGYKMPIIQSGMGFEYSDVELQQKIKECVQIEVKEGDKMPPLVCELCIDKVNDFYEFLEMCRQTNMKTRQRLGLPLHSSSQTSESDDCILGMTEQVYVSQESSAPVTKPGPKSKKVNNITKGKQEMEKNIIKQEKGRREDSKVPKEESKGRKEDSKLRKECKVTIEACKGSKEDNKEEIKDKKKTQKVEGGRRWKRELEDLKIQADLTMKRLETIRSSRRESRAAPESRSSSTSSRSSRRAHTTTHEYENTALSRTTQEHQKKTETPRPGPKSILKKGKKPSSDSHEDALLVQGKKRPREIDLLKLEVPSKKARVTLVTPKRPATPRPGPKSKRARSPSPPPARACALCPFQCASTQGMSSHMRAHGVTFTHSDLACNACGEWFLNAEETSAHHKRHRSMSIAYGCRHCHSDFKHQQAYHDHILDGECRSWEPTGSVKCSQCERDFASAKLRDKHVCTGAREGTAKCSNCSRNFSSPIHLKTHMKNCKATSKKDDVKVSPKVRRSLKPVQVRVSRCDSLLRKKKRRVDVSKVSDDYGLDPKCVYPYRQTVPSRVRIKQETLEIDGMVSIRQEIKDEFYTEEDYVHWDSDLSSDSEDDDLINKPFPKNKKVDSLTALSLKTIFSKRCLGKVPRKLRKVKPEKLFDSIFNESDITDNINTIIDNLADDEDVKTGSKDNVSTKLSFNDIGFNDDSDSFDQDRSILGSNTLSLVNEKDSENNELKANDANETDACDVNIEKNTKDAKVKEGVDTIIKDNITADLSDGKDTTGANIADDDNQAVKADDANSEVSDKTDLENVSQNGDSDDKIGEKVNGQSEISDKNATDESAIDHRKLLEELDAQIAASDSRNPVNNDKITLDDLVTKNRSSTGLDNISDEEFNFDV